MALDSIFVGCYERFVFRYDIHRGKLVRLDAIFSHPNRILEQVRLERTASHAAHTVIQPSLFSRSDGQRLRRAQ